MRSFFPSLLLLIMFQFLFNGLKGQDWPNLAKYRDANQELGAPAPGEERVVFMGNSIIEAWGNIDPDFFSSHGYINRGISGQTTPQMLIRFRPDVIDLKPAAVVILAGTNDIAGNTGPASQKMIVDNIKSMVELALAQHVKVILCSVLPAINYPWRPGIKPAPKIIALNQELKAYAGQKDIIYLDYFSAMADERNGLPKKYSGDGVHPNQAGYAVMEPMAVEAITSALEE